MNSRKLLMMIILVTSVSSLPQQQEKDSPQLTPEKEIISILSDIKSVISNLTFKGITGIGQGQMEGSHQLMEVRHDLYEDKFKDMQNSVDMLSDKGNQNIELMMQSFSALKILVTVQSEQIRHTLTRLEALEDNIKSIRFDIDKTNNIDSTTTDFTFEDLLPSSSTIDAKSNQNTKLKDIKHSIKSEILKDIKQEIESNNRQTNSSIDIIKTDISNVRQQIRSLNINLDSFKLSKQPNMEAKNELKGNCTCQSIQTTLDKISNDSIEYKTTSDSLKEQFKLIQQFKNETDPDKFGSTVMLSRLEVLEKGVSNIPDLLTTVQELKNSTSIIQAREPLCVWPYSAGGGGCFFIHTKERLNWLDAQEHCAGLQGILAAPHNFELFRQHVLGKRLSRSYNLWIGATDEDEEGNWTWVDGRPVDKSLKLWSNSRPKTDTRLNCMELRPTFRFVAADEDCRSTRHFVCQQQRYK